ncbi:hypothetical protein FH972_020955 [Carpinus fangiana]|uniref:Proteasome endopeptidase complex n=1 Tax=Carpinus fangiana TaxID=176857 RepID=A0A5N6KN55_9ROSI|nr:hypothetical protein FH972_020955 [Carpinus fangiana]
MLQYATIDHCNGLSYSSEALHPQALRLQALVPVVCGAKRSGAGGSVTRRHLELSTYAVAPSAHPSSASHTTSRPSLASTTKLQVFYTYNQEGAGGPWPLSSTPTNQPSLHPTRSRTKLLQVVSISTLSTRKDRPIRTTFRMLISRLSYTDNGGSTLAISGADFAILAGDTRSTSGYNINSRYVPKVFRIGSTLSSENAPHLASKDAPKDEKDDAHIVLAVCGYAADAHALRERLDTAVKMYRYQHGKPMSLAACAQRLSHILYGKRFFPYYVNCILGGLDADGKGALYSYDPVGSYERESCRAAGAASSLIMPFLDGTVKKHNQYIPGSGVGHDLKPVPERDLPRDEVEALVVDAFAGAAERHIEVGDGLLMMIVTKNGIEEKYRELKKD